MFVLNSWVSWVNFCWVVVPIQVRVAVVGGSNLGLVCGLLQTWWLIDCSEFEIFLFGLVVLYFWIDLIL